MNSNHSIKSTKKTSRGAGKKEQLPLGGFLFALKNNIFTEYKFFKRFRGRI